MPVNADESTFTIGDEKAAQRTGRYRPHSFFDNPPPNIRSRTRSPQHPAPDSALPSSRKTSFSSSDTHRSGALLSPPHSSAIEAIPEIEVDVDARIAFAHYGYIYALHTVIRPDGSTWLISGSGDSDVKIWLCHPQGGLQFLRGFDSLTGAVLSFAFRDSLLYAGLQDGGIIVWDLETGACIRTIEAHEADVLAMSVLGGDVYTAAADGRVLRVNEEFDCTAAFKAHSGIILSSTIMKGLRDGWEFITAGNDSYVKVSNRHVVHHVTAVGSDLECRASPFARP